MAIGTALQTHTSLSVRGSKARARRMNVHVTA
jgi:hypothetical protein